MVTPVRGSPPRSTRWASDELACRRGFSGEERKKRALTRSAQVCLPGEHLNQKEGGTSGPGQSPYARRDAGSSVKQRLRGAVFVCRLMLSEEAFPADTDHEASNGCTHNDYRKEPSP